MYVFRNIRMFTSTLVSIVQALGSLGSDDFA